MKKHQRIHKGEAESKETLEAVTFEGKNKEDPTASIGLVISDIDELLK